MKTPQANFPELAHKLGIPQIWLKREDLHHFGSHKGRSIPTMMDYYWHKEQKNNFVISSSGNAALAAALYTHHHNENNPDQLITLNIFVGQRIDPKKLLRLKALTNEQIILTQTANPKQSAFQAEKKDLTGSPQDGAKLLRQSTDDRALSGYHELAKELDHIPHLQAIFIPTSSGTTAQALGECFTTLTQKPQIHIVQTEAVHPIAEFFSGAEITNTTESIACAIVDTVAYRKLKVLETIKNSGGSGWIVSDQEITDAITVVKKATDISISANSALAIAGLQKAQQSDWHWSDVVVCLITGD